VRGGVVPPAKGEIGAEEPGSQGEKFEVPSLRGREEARGSRSSEKRQDFLLLMKEKKCEKSRSRWGRQRCAGGIGNELTLAAASSEKRDSTPGV